MTRAESWRLKLLMVVLATMTTIGVVSVAGEIAVRYRERHRSTIPGVMPFLYYRHANLGYALVRDFDYFGWVHINPQGFRGVRPVKQQTDSGVFRIMAVGGSTTFDNFVSSDSATWPARLEHWLNQLAPGHQVEVINAGVPGYNLAQDLIRLETELSAYRPDLIVLYQGHNDLFANLRSSTVGKREPGQRPDEVRSVTPWGSWLERHSLLYAKLAERLKLMRFGRLRAKPQAPEGPADDGAQRFERYVAQYLAVAKALDLPVVIPQVIQITGTSAEETDPGRRKTWQASVPFADPETVLRGYRRYNEVLRTVAARYQVPFLPMADLGIAGIEYYSDEDPIHFNDRGADRFAEGMARKLLAENLVSDSTR